MRRLFMSGIFAALSAFGAQAGTVTYSYVAENPTIIRNDVTESSMADLVAGLSVLTGTITFDDTLVSVGGPIARYAPMTITVDGIDTSGLLPGNFVQISNDAGISGIDVLGTTSLVTSTTPADAIDLIWRDFDGTIFSSNTPFPGMIDINAFEDRALLFYNPRVDAADATNRFSNDRTDFTITSLTLVPAIPLPAGLPLMLGGLMAVGVFRAHRRET